MTRERQIHTHKSSTLAGEGIDIEISRLAIVCPCLYAEL